MMSEDSKSEDDLIVRGWNHLKALSLAWLASGLGRTSESAVLIYRVPPHDWLLHVAWLLPCLAVSGLMDFLHDFLGLQKYQQTRWKLHCHFPPSLRNHITSFPLYVTCWGCRPHSSLCWGCRPHLSVGGIAQNLCPFKKTAIMGLVIWPVGF